LQTNSINAITFAQLSAGWLIAAFGLAKGRGKSGQHRAPYLLTAREPSHKAWFTDRATENYRPALLAKQGKGEKVG